MLLEILFTLRRCTLHCSFNIAQSYTGANDRILKQADAAGEHGDNQDLVVQLIYEKLNFHSLKRHLLDVKSYERVYFNVLSVFHLMERAHCTWKDSEYECLELF